MPQFQSTRFSEQRPGLFSQAEIENLMRVEFDRAQRHKYPVVCMVLSIDRLGQLHDLYGYESQDEILQAVVNVLRTATRDSDFLGYRQDDRLVALFPHTAPETGALLARRLLSSAKKLRFDRDGRTLRISLSIGIAHNRHEGSLSFETLVRVAEEGLAVADSAGGDRFVETELYQLYERKRKGGAAAADARPVEPLMSAMRSTPASRAPAQEAPAPATPARESDRLGETVLEILAAQGFSADALKHMDRDMIALAIKNFQEEKRRTALAEVHEQRQHIDVLERRIAKLTHLLGVTEEELSRVAAMKGVEFGVASIYRTVQGLSEHEDQKERKREMMKEIFQANFELKKKITPDGDRLASRV